MQNSTFIKEIFTSIQGEGPYVGFNQLFVRFSKCNLNCTYCDTDFVHGLKEYTPEELINVVNAAENIHSISLTGGEPLLDAAFLKEFLPLTDKKIYLETNGTLPSKLAEIIELVDIISMDVKLDSSSANGDLFKIHEEFIKIASEKEVFLKVVFDEKITKDEIENIIRLCKKYSAPVILQPKMDKEILNISSNVINKVFSEFVKHYDNVRLIPQVHKFLKVE